MGRSVTPADPGTPVEIERRLRDPLRSPGVAELRRAVGTRAREPLLAAELVLGVLELTLGARDVGVRAGDGSWDVRLWCKNLTDEVVLPSEGVQLQAPAGGGDETLIGYSSGPRTEKLKYTVEIPGPETERLGQIARDCDTDIELGTYATHKDWPGHILSFNAVINRDGEVAKVFWISSQKI